MLPLTPRCEIDPLRTRAIPDHLRGVFTTRRYTNPRLPHLTLQDGLCDSWATCCGCEGDHWRGARCQSIYGSATVTDSLNGCWRPICLVLGTAALC